jgi:hypothetical protein
MLKAKHAPNGPTIQQEQGATDAVGKWLAHSATATDCQCAGARSVRALSVCARALCPVPACQAEPGTSARAKPGT